MIKHHLLIARRMPFALLVAALTFVLTGCAPDAPPCNDPAVVASVGQLVTSLHDDGLRGYPAAVKDMANLSIETPRVAAYDEKLKIRSCKAEAVVRLKPLAVKDINQIISTLDNPMMAMFGGSVSVFGIKAPDPLAQLKADATVLKIVSPGPATDAPLQEAVSYRIEKEEGSDKFITSATADLSGALPYLKVAALAHPLLIQAQADAEKQAKQDQQKQAQIDGLSASGTWRKAVYIERFASSDGAGGSCESKGLFCFEGSDDQKVLGGGVLYEMDGETDDAASRQIFSNAMQSYTPVCLVNVRKTDRPGVFTAEGWSTLKNGRGDLVDCLPGAEKTEWNSATARDTRVTANGAGVPPAQAATPSTPKATGPQNLMSLITRYEACGDEAVCLYTGKGNKVMMQATLLRHMDYALLDSAIKARTLICLRDVTRSDAKTFAAESLDSTC